MSNDTHPVWPLLEKLVGYCMVMGVLIFLTSFNASNFDWAFRGEAGTIGGTGVVGLLWVLHQWYIRDIRPKHKELEDTINRVLDERDNG